MVECSRNVDVEVEHFRRRRLTRNEWRDAKCYKAVSRDNQPHHSSPPRGWSRLPQLLSLLLHIHPLCEKGGL